MQEKQFTSVVSTRVLVMNRINQLIFESDVMIYEHDMEEAITLFTIFTEM